MAGVYGSAEHVTLLRFVSRLYPIIGEALGVMIFLTDDEDSQADIARCIGYSGRGGKVGGRTGGYYPDAIWEIRDKEGNEYTLIIEIGGFDCQKARSEYPTMHVSFDKKVSLINAKREDELVFHVVNSVRYLLLAFEMVEKCLIPGASTRS